MKELKRKWLIYSIGGLLLTGAGLSVSIDAAFMKYQYPDLYNWIWQGTLGLIVFNSGLCFIGQAVIFRVRVNKDL